MGRTNNGADAMGGGVGDKPIAFVRGPGNLTGYGVSGGDKQLVACTSNGDVVGNGSRTC